MPSVLVVDDSMYFRLVLEKLLKELGHEILGEAADGEQAAIKYTKLNPDFVTMDISMPNTSGLESVAKIMEIDPNAKIIMVSALGQKEMVLEAMQLGARHFVVKPMEKNALKTAIDIVIST